jgi:hypothetical protein
MRLVLSLLVIFTLLQAKWHEIQKLVPLESYDGTEEAFVTIDGEHAILGDVNELFFYQLQEDGWSQIQQTNTPVGEVLLQNEVAYVSRQDGVVIYEFDQGSW